MKPVDCSLPETILVVAPYADAGIPIDAITAACSRADAVLHLLMAQFSGESNHRFADGVILNALWDVQGTLDLVEKLALYGAATSMPRPKEVRS
jgi:hypothetical protein